MPEASPANQPVATKPSPEVKKPINWKRIGIIAIIAAIVIGGLGYAVVALDIFGTPKEEAPAKKTTTPSSKPKKTSPLKNKIAFIRSDFLSSKEHSRGISTCSDYDIYTINTDGSDLTKVIDNSFKGCSNVPDGESDLHLSDLSWSSTGTYLAWLKIEVVVGKPPVRKDAFEFVRSGKLNRKSVSTINASENKAITGYAISPDEKKVVLLEASDSPTNLPSEFTSVTARVVDLETKSTIAEINTITGSGQESERAYTDNKSLVWLSKSTIATFGREGTKYFLASYKVNEGLSSKKKLAEGPFSSLSVTTDGSRLAFLKYEGELQLWTVGEGGANAKKLSTLAEDSLNISSLKYSPNKKYIGLATSIAEATIFFVIDTATGKNIFPKTQGVYLFNISWSPQSDSIAAKNGVYTSKVSIVGLDGKVVRDLTEADETQKTYYHSPSWFPQ
jgi:hypothetical protein